MYLFIGNVGLGLSAIGAVASIATQNIAVASVPLTIGVGCNLFSRKQHHEALVEALNKQEVTITQLQQQLEEKQNNLEQEIKEKLQENHREAGNLIEGVKDSLNTNLEKSKEEFAQEIKRLEIQSQELSQQVSTLKQVENLTQNIGSEENSASFYYQRGVGYEKLNNQEGALKDYNQAIIEDSSFAKAYHKRGVIFMNQGKKQQAVDDLRKAALLYFEQGDIESYHQAREMSRNVHDIRVVNVSDNSSSSPDVIVANELFS